MPHRLPVRPGFPTVHDVLALAPDPRVLTPYAIRKALHVDRWESARTLRTLAIAAYERALAAPAEAVAAAEHAARLAEDKLMAEFGVDRATAAALLVTFDAREPA